MMQVTDCFAPSEKATLSLEPRKVIGDSNTTMYLWLTIAEEIHKAKKVSYYAEMKSITKELIHQ